MTKLSSPRSTPRQFRRCVPLVGLVLLEACGSNGNSSSNSSGNGSNGSNGSNGGDGGDGRNGSSSGNGVDGGEGSSGGTDLSGGSNAPSSASTVVTSIIDRLDFGNAASEAAHAFNDGDTDRTTAGVGGFDQSFRKPNFVTYPGTPANNKEKLTFTIGVDPTKLNHLTIKLWGSDQQVGVLRLLEVDGVPQEIDNNNSSAGANVPFVARFQYATNAIPLALTQGKSTVTLTLYSSGYSYDAGGWNAGNPTRGIYSAFTHPEPYFVPPSSDNTGVPPVQTGYAPPTAVDRATIFGWMKHSRANIFNLDNVPDPGWNLGGTLVHEASVIPAGTPGAPPEVIGMRYGDGPVLQSDIDYMMSQPSPADAWRNGVQNATYQGMPNQMRAVNVLTTVYLAPPLKDVSGAVVPGYDKYLDPAQLQTLVGVYDGLTRMQTGSTSGLGGWAAGCAGNAWAGITSTPRATGPWAGTTARQDPGCISFEGESGVNLGRSMLRLLVDNPDAASAFKTYLDQSFDVDLNNQPIKRAYAYERMLAASVGWMGFGLQALTSTNYFDKAGGTAYQEMIFLQYTYAAQLALRQLQTIFPNADADKQPIDTATMRSIVRQIVGLDNMTFMQPGDIGWRAITSAGIAEDYGTLSSGYDGRYGAGVPVKVGAMATLTKYDRSLSAQDNTDFAAMARNTIAAFDNFIYPQHQITTAADGTFTDQYALGQDDVISYRVPYGPNANGWNLNLQVDAVDPGGIILSPLARRAFMIDSSRGANADNGDMTAFLEQEAAWQSIAGVDPATVPALPGEPGSPDFVWADVQSGALALSYKGERLFMNANYNRPKGDVNNFARIHHVTDLVDREATVSMPFDSTTVQNDGNVSGDASGAWVVRYGHYLVVMNRSSTNYLVQMPPGAGTVTALHAAGIVAADSNPSVAPGGYEVYYLP